MVRVIIAKIYKKITRTIGAIRNNLRILHFRLMGIKIGKKCFIEKGVLLLGNVSIGDNCDIGSNTYIGTFSGAVIIEDNCHIGNMNQIGSSGTMVRIGRDCIFAPYVMVTDATHSFRDQNLIIKESPIIAKPIEIGCNVWIGAAALVMSGVSIGSGAVIGAKALVNKDIPSNAVAVGSPAKVIYFRGEGV